MHTTRKRNVKFTLNFNDHDEESKNLQSIEESESDSFNSQSDSITETSIEEDKLSESENDINNIITHFNVKKSESDSHDGQNGCISYTNTEDESSESLDHMINTSIDGRVVECKSDSHSDQTDTIGVEDLEVVKEEENMEIDEKNLSNGNYMQGNSYNNSLNTVLFEILDSETSIDEYDNENNIFGLDHSINDNKLKTLEDTNFNFNNRQIQVVEWMITRERQEPYGGIIAIDMGNIDNTISIIMSLIFKSKVPNSENTQSEGETDLDESVIEKGRTLIICTKARMDEWSECVHNKISPNVLSVCMYYGRNRNKSPQSLSQMDIVITTVTLVTTGFRCKKNNPLYQIKWNRIILDDALCACNYKLQTSRALCQLSGICHWAFAGPKFVEDDDNAMYSLMKFIHYKPLNNIDKWKKWLKKNPKVTVKEKLKHFFYS